MVDFDLEAAGMTHFFRNIVSREAKNTKSDALDFLLDAKKIFKQSNLQTDQPSNIRISDYVVNIPLKGWKDATVRMAPHTAMAFFI